MYLRIGDFMELSAKDFKKISSMLMDLSIMYSAFSSEESAEVLEYSKALGLISEFMCSDDVVEIDKKNECVDYVHG